MRIIVIEDEERLLHGLIHLIERIGEQFKVVGSAMDGVSGLALIEQLRPDVTFTDIRMPGMSGLDLIGRLSTRQPPACRFVIISAYSDFEYARQALRYGVFDYILRPVTYEEIERLLYRLADVPLRSPFEQGMVEEAFPMPDPSFRLRHALGYNMPPVSVPGLPFSKNGSRRERWKCLTFPLYVISVCIFPSAYLRHRPEPGV